MSSHHGQPCTKSRERCRRHDRGGYEPLISITKHLMFATSGSAVATRCFMSEIIFTGHEARKIAVSEEDSELHASRRCDHVEFSSWFDRYRFYSTSFSMALWEITRSFCIFRHCMIRRSSMLLAQFRSVSSLSTQSSRLRNRCRLDFPGSSGPGLVNGGSCICYRDDFSERILRQHCQGTIFDAGSLTCLGPESFASWKQSTLFCLRSSLKFCYRLWRNNETPFQFGLLKTSEFIYTPK